MLPHFVKMTVPRPKSNKITAARRFAPAHSKPIRRRATCTVSVWDVSAEASNKVRKLEQTIYELTNKVLLIEPLITRLLPHTSLTKTPEISLREHLVVVCQTTDSISSEIKQQNPKASDTVVFNAHVRIPSEMPTNAVLSAWSITGHSCCSLRPRERVLSRSCPTVFHLRCPAVARRFLRSQLVIASSTCFKTIKITSDKTFPSEGDPQAAFKR